MFEPDGGLLAAGRRSTGFQWGDAGIGAGFTLGIVLLIAGAGAGLFLSRQSRRREAAHA